MRRVTPSAGRLMRPTSNLRYVIYILSEPFNTEYHRTNNLIIRILVPQFLHLTHEFLKLVEVFYFLLILYID